MVSTLLTPALALALPLLFAAAPPCPGGPGCHAAAPAYASSPAPATNTASSAWSSWLSVDGDYSIVFRFRVNTYGSGISPDCEVEFRNDNGRVDFRYKINHTGGAEAGIAYGITRYDTLTEMVDPCRWVSSVTVTDVRRRQ
jgi:hypothetical protein